MPAGAILGCLKIIFMAWVNYNGDFFPESALPVAASDIGLRYGISLFETMRWTGGKVPLLAGHYHRLTAGLKMLHTSLPSFFTLEALQTEIQKTVKRNEVAGDARIRLQVTPDLKNKDLHTFSGMIFRIECVPCEPLTFNALGLRVDFSENDYRSNPSPFCYFKTGNYAPYFLASLEARKRGLDDVLLLNAGGNVGESATANVFWAECNRLLTPPLSEGVVAGVARGRLLQVLSQSGFITEEEPLSKARLLQADSVFLTNAFRGLRWVAACGDKTFSKGLAESLFKKAFLLGA